MFQTRQAPRPRVVFDTNALISALILPNSITAKALYFAVEHLEIIVSKATWQEFEQKIKKTSLERYFPSIQNRDAAVDAINRIVSHVTVRSVVTDCRDAKDNPFLELALDGRAETIITGDDDLLVLNPWRGTRIESPGDFFRERERTRRTSVGQL